MILTVSIVLKAVKEIQAQCILPRMLSTKLAKLKIRTFY
jgi:hypothetical protein